MSGEEHLSKTKEPLNQIKIIELRNRVRGFYNLMNISLSDIPYFFF